MAPPGDEEFTYDAIVNRWRRERATAALTKMDHAFYGELDRHLAVLREEYAREHAANPATPKVLILQDELMNLQRVREDIYDLREKKILTTALVTARGGNPDRGNLTREEEVLFDELLRVLRDARRNLLRRGQAPAPEPAARPPAGPPAPPEPGPLGPGAAVPALAQPAAAMGSAALEAAPESPLPGAPTPTNRPVPEPEQVGAVDEGPRRMGPARVLVRVKERLEPFVGPDLRQYRLEAEDVAALPREVAHLLVTRGLAQALGA